jgi:hypothetical protein
LPTHIRLTGGLQASNNQQNKKPHAINNYFRILACSLFFVSSLLTLLLHQTPNILVEPLELRSKNMDKKRKLNVFEAVQELESEDVKAASRRRKTTAATAERAKAAQSQTKIYNHLVECRILFQRALNEESLGDSARDQCDSLMETLLQARNQLTSGEDAEDDPYTDVESADALNDVLDKEYNNCREQWKQVLNRRHKDLKLHSGITAKSQFRVIDSSFWQQVEATVEYEQMREHAEESADFDDSKVYQQLLKEFVASSAGANGAAASKRLASKKKKSQKKEVDRRGSKGRTIRYKEIPKLANFTFPLSRPVTSNLDQDEWFQSLFGGVGRSQKS